MVSRKRSIDEVDSAEPSLLDRIRNMWEFANLCQWIYIFGKAVNIPDEIDIDMLEAECLQPQSDVLQDIGLALLKTLSSQRGLTHDIFDEYARRQFVAKDPNRNLFGTDTAPARFREFDVFTKIRVLQRLTQWTMINPQRIREKMEDQKDNDQSSWRIEPYGWDRHDRTYFVLDDNRVYRLTERPQVHPPSKRKKVRSRAKAASALTTDDLIPNETEEDGLGGMTWECLAVTLDDVHRLVETFQRTRDPNEKILCTQIQEHLVPILQKQEESRRRKVLQRERELQNLAKMANAKRSSRIAGRAEQQRREEQARAENERRQAEEAAAKRAEQTRLKLERERNLKMMTREKRLQDRESRRLHREEEAPQSENDREGPGHRTNGLSNGQPRQPRQSSEQAPSTWVFDCVCGVHGQVDDGTHSIACEKCDSWQHSKCVGIGEEEAESPEFHFVCDSCRRGTGIGNGESPGSRMRPIIKLKAKLIDAVDEAKPDETTTDGVNAGDPATSDEAKA